MDYAVIWFVFWAVLWTAYMALDGFDLGVGYSYWLAASDDEGRRRAFASIAPFWDGNEVWLVTAGGATFAAFPAVYASLFSWLYSALYLLLFSLIFRGVALEFRGKVESPAWRRAWERTAAGASFAATLLLGVAFGNIFRGLEIGPAGYQGTFPGLLNPAGLAAGLFFLALFLYHGQLWLASRGAEGLSARAAAVAGKAWYALAALLVAYAFAGFLTPGPGLPQALRLLPVLLAVFFLAWSLRQLRRGDFTCAFRASFALIVLVMAAGFFKIFPALLPSRLAPAFSLTIYNSASSQYTLRLMTWVVLIFLPVVIGYQVWVYRLFRAPLTDAELSKSGMY